MEPRNPDREQRPEGQNFERNERSGGQAEGGDDFQRSPSGGQFRPADTENRPNRGQGNPNKKK